MFLFDLKCNCNKITWIFWKLFFNRTKSSQKQVCLLDNFSVFFSAVSWSFFLGLTMKCHYFEIQFIPIKCWILLDLVIYHDCKYSECFHSWFVHFFLWIQFLVQDGLYTNSCVFCMSVVYVFPFKNCQRNLYMKSRTSAHFLLPVFKFKIQISVMNTSF